MKVIEILKEYLVGGEVYGVERMERGSMAELKTARVEASVALLSNGFQRRLASG